MLLLNAMSPTILPLDQLIVDRKKGSVSHKRCFQLHVTIDYKYGEILVKPRRRSVRVKLLVNQRINYEMVQVHHHLIINHLDYILQSKISLLLLNESSLRTDSI